jgi:chorismate dehydratase
MAGNHSSFVLNRKKSNTSNSPKPLKVYSECGFHSVVSNCPKWLVLFILCCFSKPSNDGLFFGNLLVKSDFPLNQGETRPIRVGAVSYLNTKPLIYGLKEHLADRGTLDLALPSRLADDLKAGLYDVALIPSIEFFRNPDYSIISDACIACHGEVWSVKLLFRVPPSQVKTIALDEGSRTSATLAKVLLWSRFGIRPESIELPIEGDFRLSQADAVLIIGDRAMGQVSSGFTEAWDLGREWAKDTGLPFVFAMWVGRMSDRSAEIATVLQQARDEGCNQATKLAKKYAADYHLSIADCEKYFTHYLHYYLGDRELAGLQLFYDRAAQLELAPRGHNFFSETLLTP